MKTVGGIEHNVPYTAFQQTFNFGDQPVIVVLKKRQAQMTCRIPALQRHDPGQVGFGHRGNRVLRNLRLIQWQAMVF